MKKKVLIIAAALVVVLGTAVGVGVYFIIQSLSHPPEETAKFLPMETSFYVSMNLRPGAGQLMKAREIRDLFKENPKFEEKLDELYEDIEEETGINVEEDLFPWLGPEIAMAIPTFEGIDETPEFVAFIGATDTAAAETFLRKLIAFGEESNGTEYEERVTRGYLTFVVDPSDDVSTHIVLTDDYIVIATGAETLESTLDRMDSGQDQDRSSLFDNPGFQEAREAAESPRFGIMYVDIAGIIDQLGEDFDGEDVESLRVFSDQLPDFIVASLAFIEKGIRVSTSFDRPDQLFVTASTNSVGSAGRAPEDTVALLSFVGVQDAWKKFRDEVADLPYLDLDEALHEIESDIGIDIEQDIFGWMTGELAFAMLLPGGVPFSSDEIHANAYVEFDDRAKALSSMEKIQDAIEDSGVEFRVVDVEGTDAVVMDLGDDQGPPNLTPGYVVLDNYVVIGTTLTSLRQAVEAERGDIPSLRESSAFSRPLAAAGNSTDFMIYGNIKRIVKEVLDQLDETELEEYGETAEPFVEPLEAFLLGVAVEEDIFTFSTVITFAATTDTPTPEPTPTQTGTPTDTPTPEPTPTQTGTMTDTPTPEPTPTQTGTPTDHAGTHAHSDRDSDGHSYAGTHAHSDRDSDGHSHAGTHAHSDRDSDGHSYAGTHAHSDRDSDGHSHAGTHAHSDRDSDGHSHAGTHAHSDRDSDGHSHAGTYAHSDRDSDGHSHAHSDRNANGHAPARVAGERAVRPGGFVDTRQLGRGGWSGLLQRLP